VLRELLIVPALVHQTLYGKWLGGSCVCDKKCECTNLLVVEWTMVPKECITRDRVQKGVLRLGSLSYRSVQLDGSVSKLPSPSASHTGGYQLVFCQQ
jgi:hypothetical protein